MDHDQLSSGQVRLRGDLPKVFITLGFSISSIYECHRDEGHPQDTAAECGLISPPLTQCRLQKENSITFTMDNFISPNKVLCGFTRSIFWLRCGGARQTER
jgi:hypothetical protein